MRLTIFLVAASALFAQSPSTFETHLAAGQAAIQQSRYTEADSQLRAAVSDAAQPDPARSPMRVAEAYSALCDLDLLLGRYDEAIAMGTKAVEAVESQLPADSPGTADLTPHLARLAGAYRVAGKTNLAIPVLIRMLSIDQALAPDGPKIATDYDKLGSAYLELGVMAEARTSYQKALDSRISRLGPDHLDVATSWVNLGVLEVRSEKPKPAQTDFETALAISEKNLGTESYGITGILDRLGKLFSDQKKYSDAEPVFQLITGHPRENSGYDALRHRARARKPGNSILFATPNTLRLSRCFSTRPS